MDNLGLPEVTHAPHLLGEGAVVPMNEVPVDLICKGALLNGIGQWKNVTYLIEWVADGKPLKTEKKCDVRPGKTHKDPCPNKAQIDSKLDGLKYKIGQWVRMDNFLNLCTILYTTCKF